MNTVELVQDPARLLELWPRIRPDFERCVTEACRGEIVVDDILDLAMLQRAWVIVVWEGDEPVVSLAIEYIYFPRMTTANIFALGGSGLIKAKDKYWPVVLDWLRGNGVDAVDAWVDRGMKRILTSERFGFEQAYHHLRLDIGARDETSHGL